MNTKKLLTVLLLALTSGGLASYLSLGYTSQAATAAPAAAPTLGMIVAARSLAPGQVLQAADVREVPWAAEAPPVGIHTRVEDVVGKVVTTPLADGEPLLASALAAGDAGSGLPALIPEGKRAVSIPVDEVVGVNGFVAPGTRVDVIATLEPVNGDGDAVSRVVLQDVDVLATGHQLQADPNGAPQQVPVVTLLVTPEQAESLILATHKGRIQLALRGRLDRAAVATRGAGTATLRLPARTGPAPAGPAKMARRQSVAGAAPADRAVEVFNGGTRTLVRY